MAKARMMEDEDSMANEFLQKYNKIKQLKLLAAVIIDLVGITTYFIPFFGESGDLLWAPISGLLIYVLFPNRKNMAFTGVLEEFLPIADFVPTAFLAWRLEYIRDKNKTLSEFLKNEFYEEQLAKEIQNKYAIEDQNLSK